MRHYSLKLLCLALTFLLWVYPAAVSKAYTDVRDLEAFLDGVMAIHLEQSRTPGAVIAVVNEGGILLAKGYGYANLEEGKKVTTDTLFRVGSISKLFVWTAVMQLQQEGLLDLDRDINAYLDFEIPSTLWDGTFAEPITLRHLMSHTAGFEDQNIGVFVLTEEQLKPLSDYLAEALPARVFPPGQISSYSNYGSSLAAYIVQRIAGMPFADYVEKQIFAPLGITGSTFRQPVPDHLLPQLSAGYQPLDELYLLGDFELCQSYPAGSLSASAEDMATFMLAHLTEETYGLMHKQSFTHHPALPGMAHGFFEMDINGQRIITHGGDTILFHSGLYLLPEEQVGIFMSFNGAQASEVRSSVLQAFMDRYFPQDTKPLTPSGDLVQRAAQIRGSFHLSRSNFTDIEAILRLFSPIKISVDGDGYLVLQGAISSHRYIETDTGLFRSLDGQALLYPARDSTGQVTHFYTDFPAVLLRTPWYATAEFTLLLAGLCLAVLVGAVIHWVRLLLRRGAGQDSLSWPGRVVVLLLAMTQISFYALLFTLIGNTHPVLGIPMVALEMTPTVDYIRVVSWFHLLLTLMITVLALYQMVRRTKYLQSLLYSGVSLGFGFLLYYWNFL